jgi:hypothetical protein
MKTHLEEAIKSLEMAETCISSATASLEWEANSMTVKDEDSRLRYKDIVDTLERCHLELMRKVRLRRRFLISVQDGYAYGKMT